VDHLQDGFFVEARPWMAPRWLCVFDDALVEVRARRAFSAFGLLGPVLGDWLKNTFVLRTFRRKIASVEALGLGATSSEVAANIRGSRRIALSEIASAELKKFGRTTNHLLVLHTSGGQFKWVVQNDKRDQLAGLLAPLLGSRLTGASAAPDAAARPGPAG
jgi:hypothetical protein